MRAVEQIFTSSALQGLPESVARSGPPPAHRLTRLVTPVYGSLRYSFSGSTWYFAQAGMAESALEGAFSLNPEGRFNARLQAAGALWKAQRVMCGARPGGFKFVQAFHDILWSQNIDRLGETVIINNTQIYGPAFFRRNQSASIIPCFYIDGTLSEYLYGYGDVEDQTIGSDIVRRAIELEREGYQRAARILTMSRATARDLVETYGVAAEKIVVVLPGANLDDEAVPAPLLHNGWIGAEFTLGFVGLFPLRKGLDKLAGAVKLLRERKAPVRLRIIGRCPDEIAAMDGVDFLGPIDKLGETPRFIEAIQTVDLGCQLSRVELLGIALLEFLRVGVPVLATAVGGVPDVLHEGGGLLVAADVSVEQLAHELFTLMSSPTRYAALKRAAVERSGWASWRRAVREVDVALAGLS